MSPVMKRKKWKADSCNTNQTFLIHSNDSSSYDLCLFLKCLLQSCLFPIWFKNLTPQIEVKLTFIIIKSLYQ